MEGDKHSANMAKPNPGNRKNPFTKNKKGASKEEETHQQIGGKKNNFVGELLTKTGTFGENPTSRFVLGTEKKHT